MKSIKLAGLVSLTLMAGCVAPVAPPPPAPPPAAPPPPPPQPVVDWRDAPLTQGDWAYRTDAAGTQAMFGQPGDTSHFILRCDSGSRTITLSRLDGQAAAMTVITSSQTMNWPASPTGRQPSYAVVSLRGADPFLDRIAFSQGRIAVQMTNMARLILPARAEPARVIEDCRR